MNMGTHYHCMQKQNRISYQIEFDTLYVEYGSGYIEYGIRLSLHANTKCMFHIKYTLVTLLVSET